MNRGTWNPNETPEERAERLKRVEAFVNKCNAAPADRGADDYREWSHFCDGIPQNITLWTERCPHCGKARPSVSQAGQTVATTIDGLEALINTEDGAPPVHILSDGRVIAVDDDFPAQPAQAGPQQKADERDGKRAEPTERATASQDSLLDTDPVSSAPPPQSRESETPETDATLFTANHCDQYSDAMRILVDTCRDIERNRNLWRDSCNKAEDGLAELTQENLEHARVQVVRNRMIEELNGKLVALARERDTLREALRAVNDAMPGAFQCVTDALSSPGGGA